MSSRRAQSSLRKLSFRGFLLILLVLFAASAGCSKESLGMGSLAILSDGVINDPKNKSLRFDILKFGLEQFCREMTRRGAPLKLNDDQPVIGRFFADSCSTQVLDDDSRKSFVVQYSGRGYGWTNLSGRIGFTTAGVVEYAPDFQKKDDALYVYFRPRNISAASFQTLMVESGTARAGMAITGVNADQLGRQIVDGQLRRGFTVIRYNDKGETDFGLGYIPIGQRAFKPFQIKSSDKLVLANDRTEVHTNQQDFVGGFEITDSGQAIYLTMSLDGAPAVDVFVVPKGNGDLMMDAYTKNPGPAQLTAAPLLDDPLLAGQIYKRFVPLPKGLYYVVLDHSASVGRTQPPAQVGSDQAAKVDYVVQVGDAP